MSFSQNQKQVGITPQAHAALGALRRAVIERGIPMTLGAIASQIILAAKPEDVCRGRK